MRNKWFRKVGIGVVTAAVLLANTGIVVPEKAFANDWETFGFKIDDDDRLTMYDGTDSYVVIPKDVTKIGTYSFSNNKYARNVVIPASVKIIEHSAFAFCENLETVELPEGIGYIDYGAFALCDYLKDIDIPDSVYYLGDGAFACSGLEHVKLPSGISTIEKDLFNRSKLRSIDIPSNITKIGDGAFWDCDLESIVIPDSVTSLGWCAFAYCKKLKTVTLSPNISDMDSYIFQSSAITEVVIPEGMTAIGVSMFEDCEDLKKVTISDSVTTIGGEAFLDCNQLAEITLPVSVTNIGENVLEGCVALKDIYYGGTKQQWEALAVELPDTDEPIRVHYNCKPFRATDVKLGGWQETAARYMLEHGLMSGKTESTFDPNTAMNRGQLVAVLWNMAGKPSVTGKTPFADVPSTNTFYKAILWASQNKIVNGYANGTFGPKDPLTRQQIATILMNYAKYCGIAIENKADISSYKDVANVSKSLSSAVQWAVGNKIISGKSSGTMLDPKGQATRIEVAAMVMNYCKKILGM